MRKRETPSVIFIGERITRHISASAVKVSPRGIAIPEGLLFIKISEKTSAKRTDEYSSHFPPPPKITAEKRIASDMENAAIAATRARFLQFNIMRFYVFL